MKYLTEEQIEAIRAKANKKKRKSKLIPPHLQKTRGRKPGQKNKPKNIGPEIIEADYPADLTDVHNKIFVEDLSYNGFKMCDIL